MEGTIRCSANYVPLSPISFLKRAAAVYGERDSVVYENVRYTWRETLHRCTKLASSLSQIGIARGDVVAVLSPNIPSTYELHFAVPMAGAIICTLNIHLDSKMISTLLEHSEAKIIFVDYEYLEIAKEAFDILAKKGIELPRLVLVPESPYTSAFPLEENLDYEKLLSMGNSDFEIKLPNDECDPIALNYTSGTTSGPKGVVYSHRGVYLNSLSVALLQEMPSMPVYLWTVPMFHCNGWCFIWALAAQGGTNIFLRTVSSEGIFESICRHKVTHMGGAPTVLNIIINSPARERKPLPGKVTVLTEGAPPPQVLFKMEEQGFHVTHGYGLTETYGFATVCTWKPEWNSLPLESQAKIKSRQGLQHLGLEEVDVKDPKTMIGIPKDAKTMGEVMFRGNTVMNGYLKDPISTKNALKDGWFRSGDIGVKHPDGYIELKDRSKDIIISGGENISTIEVESVLFSHPKILEASVVARPDDYWGETPCAFVKLKDGCNASSDEIIEYCRDNLPRYMAPRTVIFEDLPMMSTRDLPMMSTRDLPMMSTRDLPMMSTRDLPMMSTRDLPMMSTRDLPMMSTRDLPMMSKRQ